MWNVNIRIFPGTKSKITDILFQLDYCYKLSLIVFDVVLY